MSKEVPEGRKSRSQWKVAADHGSLGIEMGLAVALGYYAGQWLDEEFGTEPWLLILFLLVGFGAAAKALIRTALRAREALRDDRGANDGEEP